MPSALYIRDKDGNFVPIYAIRGANGKSAYELACEGGYKGTKEEFIAMLNGLTSSEDAAHYADFDNPHRVEAHQIGAIPSEYGYSNDLNYEIGRGGGIVDICWYDSGSLNSPYKEGHEGCEIGMVITNAYSSDNGTQLCMPSGSSTLYVRNLSEKNISEWVAISGEDIAESLSTSRYNYDNSVKKSGDTMTGDLNIQKSSLPTIWLSKEGADNHSMVRHTDDVDTTDIVNIVGGTSTTLSLANETVNALPFLLRIWTSNAKCYNIFGEHNKPMGTYKGNGSATERRIKIGAPASALCIYVPGGNASALVTPSGGLYWGGGTYQMINAYYFRVENDELVIATSMMNENTVNYTYQVI